MKVDGILERAQLEPRTTDHPNTITGAIWLRTDLGRVHAIVGGASRHLLDQSSLDNSTLEYNSGSIRLKDGGVTKSKLTSVGQQVVNIGGGNPQVVSSTSATDVNGLSVTITTSGRPVFLGLQGENGVLVEGPTNGSSASGAIFFKRGATSINFMPLTSGGSLPQSGQSQQLILPLGCFWYIDTPAAGTYTYKVQAQTQINGGYLFFGDKTKFIVYEM